VYLQNVIGNKGGTKMTVKEIIRSYCSVHYPEADGLCSEDCGCSFDEMNCEKCGSINCVIAIWNEEEERFEAIRRKE
jgi:hypothetical protein